MLQHLYVAMEFCYSEKLSCLGVDNAAHCG